MSVLLYFEKGQDGGTSQPAAHGILFVPRTRLELGIRQACVRRRRPCLLEQPA